MMVDQNFIVASSVISILAGIVCFKIWNRKPNREANPPMKVAIPPNSEFMVLSSGIKIRYKDTGLPKKSSGTDFTTLLMVHGFGGCLETWIPVTKMLQNKYRIVAIDLVCNGFSDKPLHFYNTFRNQGKFVSDFIEEFNLQNVILVGHSSGSVVAASSPATVASSNRVRGAVLIAPGIFMDKPIFFSFPFMKPIVAILMKYMFQDRHNKLLKQHKHENTFSDEIASAFVSTTQTENYMETMILAATSREPPLAQVLKDVVIPLHIIWSDEDTINPPAQEKVNALINDGKLNVKVTMKVITDTYHYLHHEQPKQIANEICQFVDSVVGKD